MAYRALGIEEDQPDENCRYPDEDSKSEMEKGKGKKYSWCQVELLHSQY